MVNIHETRRINDNTCFFVCDNVSGYARHPAHGVEVEQVCVHIGVSVALSAGP